MDKVNPEDIQVSENIHVTIVQNRKNNSDTGSDGYELVSLGCEYSKHLSCVVLNNVNQIHILLYDLIPTNLSYLCTIVSTIRNSIFNSLKLLASTSDILCHTHTIINSNSRIICQFKYCLKNNTSKLNDLHDNLLNLSDSYGYFHYLKNQLQTIIDCSKDTNSLNSKLSQIVEKFKFSLSEFQEIECLLNSIKSIIYELKNRKDQLMDLTNELGTQQMDSVCFQIKCCCDKIDRIFGAIEDVEFHTWCLKYWICKFINLDLSNNLLNRLLFFDKIMETDIDEICSNVKSLCCSIWSICNICNSNCERQCTCNCVSECNENTICLCLCDDTKAVNKECCICICKHKSNPKCVCICICNKPGSTCECGTGKTHNCDKCLVKVDIKSLKDQTSRILCCLRCITLYLPIFNKKCCYCRCCENGRCGNPCCIRCQSITKYYLSIISNIHSIEYLFKEVGTKILELTKMNKTLSFYFSLVKECKSCNCKDKIESLIRHIQSALRYYYLFGSRLDEIGYFVYYKIFYSKLKQILNMLTLSVNPLSKQLKLINSQMVGNMDYAGTSNKLLFSFYSKYSLIQAYLIMSNLLKYSSKLSITLYINQWIEICVCVKNFNSNGYSFKTTYFYKYLIDGSNNIHKLKRLFIPNDGNHMCLCLVIKYVLYPNLLKCMYYLRGLYLMAIGNLTKDFLTNDYIFMDMNMIKMLFLAINVVYKISVYMKLKYYFPRFCLCMDMNDKYDYNYLISIILFVSSLVENIWTMDPETVRMSIERLSVFISIINEVDCVYLQILFTIVSTQHHNAHVSF